MCIRIYDNEKAPANELFKNFADNNLLAFKNEQEKDAKLNYFKETPLLVDSGDLIQITPEIISFINSGSIGDSIRTYIADLLRFCKQEFDQYEVSENKSPKM